jgi:hypothetical protein
MFDVADGLVEQDLVGLPRVLGDWIIVFVAAETARGRQTGH